MRIAAKRLRYVLEATESCFGRAGPVGAPARQGPSGRAGRDPRLRRDAPAGRAPPRRAARARRGRRARARRRRRRTSTPSWPRGRPHRTAYRGLEVLAVYLRARRKLLFDRFAELWAELERRGVWDWPRALRRRRVLREAQERRRAAERAAEAERQLAEAEREEREAAERAGGQRRSWRTPNAPPAARYPDSRHACQQDRQGARRRRRGARARRARGQRWASTPRARTASETRSSRRRATAATTSTSTTSSCATTRSTTASLAGTNAEVSAEVTQPTGLSQLQPRLSAARRSARCTVNGERGHLLARRRRADRSSPRYRSPPSAEFDVEIRYKGKPKEVTDPDGSTEGWVRTDDGAFVVGRAARQPGLVPVQQPPARQGALRHLRRGPEAVQGGLERDARTSRATATGATFNWTADRADGHLPGDGDGREVPHRGRRRSARHHDLLLRRG